MEKHIFEEYYEWHDGLSKDTRDKFEFIRSIAIYRYSIRLWELAEQYLIRRQFALIKFKDYENFVKDELYNASLELTQVPLSCDWERINHEFKRIREGDKISILKNEYFGLNGFEGNLSILFKDTIYFKGQVYGSGLADEYFSLNIDIESNAADYDTSNLRDFEKVIELMARFHWVISILNVIVSKSFNSETKNLNLIPEKYFPLLPDCFIDKQYFLNLLKNPLIEDLYTIWDDGSYHLKNDKKASLGGLAQRLLDIGKLKDFIKTSQDLAKVFCPFFNVKYNPKEDKQFQPSRSKLYDFDFIE